MLRSFIALAVSTVLLTGDIMLDRGVRRRIEADGIDALFTPAIDSALAAADVVVGNLECPATSVRRPAFKRFVFRAEPQWLGALQRHGFTHLNLANNHSVDQGRAGLEDTHRQVTAHGMTPIGAGPTPAEACRPVLLTTHPRPVYLVATLRMPLENFPPLPRAWDVSREDTDSLLRRVRELRRREPRAVIIVSPHWGWEHRLHPEPAQRFLAHRIIDAGADVVAGHHTHTLQDVETYRGRTIAYSLGNFIFDPRHGINASAAMLAIDVMPDTIRVRTIPTRIRHCAVHAAECAGNQRVNPYPKPECTDAVTDRPPT
ncbi:MAG: CapA family protein [Bacteroidaceae bacterium]|nr:CapA family protein [Bacteroidaceae bacterium]